MLRLKIENFDQLPDGGPIEFTADRRGFDFGRDQHLDWTLPDEAGVISRKHCEVRFFEQAYWLFDMSTNGTFVNKSTKRVQSPYRLNNGDELRIGDYIVSVSIFAGAPSPNVLTSENSRPIAQQPKIGSIWDTGVDAPPAIDPRDLMPPQPQIRREPDYLHQIVELPPAKETAQAVKPMPGRTPLVAPPAADTWGAGPGPEPENQPMRNRVVQLPSGLSPAVRAVEPEELPFRPSEPMFEDHQNKYAVDDAEHSQQQSATATQSATTAILGRLAKGAGLSPDIFKGRDSGQAAEDIGRLLNVFCANLMHLLNARAAAKTLSRSGNRTLIQARDNNPLKFLPTAEEALMVMLSPPTPSYMPAQKAVEGGFHDIQSHQLATLAAMQRAASDLFEVLAPDAIRKVSEDNKKSFLPVGKSNYWESYTETWEAKAGSREHGMLSAFLDAFAVYYDQETRSKKY